MAVCSLRQILLRSREGSSGAPVGALGADGREAGRALAGGAGVAALGAVRDWGTSSLLPLLSAAVASAPSTALRSCRVS